MTVDGVNILTTYGLKLVTVKDHLSSPARKKILQTPAMTANDIKMDERQFTVVLFGEYTTKAQVALAIYGIKTLFEAVHIHIVSIPAHGIGKSVVCKEGIKVEPYGTAVLLTIKMTVTDE